MEANWFDKFDKDAAGVRAIEKASVQLKMYQIKVPLYPKGTNLDPASLTSSQVERALAKAVPVLRIKQKIANARKGALINGS